MKNTFLIMALLSLAVSCDAPQRTRAPLSYVTGDSFSTGGTTSGSLTNTPAPGTTPATGTTTTTTNTPGFESCDLTHKYQTADIGWFGICQSTQDETLFKFRPSVTSTSIRTCLIPTYKDANGSSTYIGNPQCTYTTSNQIVQGKLYKDRSGFSNYPLNGVIVMKEPLLPEYINCMHAYVNWPSNVCPSGGSNPYCAYWLPRCPYGSKSNAQCDAEGRSYMGNICTNFKMKYGNSYVDIGTRNAN